MRVYEANDYTADLIDGIATVVAPSGKTVRINCWTASQPMPLPKPVADKVRTQINVNDYLWFGGACIRKEVALAIYAAAEEVRKAEQERQEAEKNARETAIPGLELLRAAYADDERYRRQFETMMADGDNDGINPPAARRYDTAALRKEYPRAACYLKAESYHEHSGHYAKAAAGRKAKELLENGGTIEAAEEIMENWLPEEAYWN